MPENKIASPLKTIRTFCLECSGSPSEVRLCPCKNCRLYDFRLGHDPRREKKQLSDDQRNNLRKRLQNKKSPVDTGQELDF